MKKNSKKAQKRTRSTSAKVLQRKREEVAADLRKRAKELLDLARQLESAPI